MDAGKWLCTQGSLVLSVLADLKLTLSVHVAVKVVMSVMAVLNVMNVLWLAASELMKFVVAAALGRAHHYA